MAIRDEGKRGTSLRQTRHLSRSSAMCLLQR
jgi:hypothetical protein